MKRFLSSKLIKNRSIHSSRFSSARYSGRAFVSLVAFGLVAVFASDSVNIIAQELQTLEEGTFDDDFLEMDLEKLVEQDKQVKVVGRQSVTDGILGGHVHTAGETMIGYSYMNMTMRGNRIGSNGISAQGVLNMGYMATPTDMSMDMSMLMVMHAPTDEWTFELMLPFFNKSMNHIRGNGSTFNVSTQGVGDLGVRALYTFMDSTRQVYSDQCKVKKNCYHTNWEAHHQMFAGMGLTFPTGSIQERNGMGMRVPYPMQLGSGTYDLEPSLTYSGLNEEWGWGAHAKGKVRVGTNEVGYQLGNEYVLDAWLARKLSDRWSTAARLEGMVWENINGSDSTLNPMMVSTADPNLRGGQRLSIWTGLTYYVPEGRLEGNRIGVDIGLPIFQVLDGPQLETDLMVWASWSWTY